MQDLFLKLLKTYGFPTVVAIACGLYVLHLDKQAASERLQASQERAKLGQLLGGQMADLQRDIEVVKTVCASSR